MPQRDQGPSPWLSYARLRFVLRVSSLMVLPPYKGAVFRGAFGGVFRRLVCVARNIDCPACLLRGQCQYSALFEPPAPTSYKDSGKFSQAPRPYVINPPLTSRQSFRPGDNLDFELVLIGRAVAALPYFIYAFMELGRKGLGRVRGRYEILSVDLLRNGAATRIYDGRKQILQTVEPESVPSIEQQDMDVSSVTLQLLTPLRLKVEGDLVTDLSFPLFFDRLAQRASLLKAFYCPDTSTPDSSPLTLRAQEVQTASKALQWYDWERYSAKQKASMKFGGLIGSITFTGPVGPFLPWLRLGEAINVGQSTTFGLGRYKIV